MSGTEDPDPLDQYVWHPYYVDALAVRYWDSNTDGDYLDANEGALYYCQDANFNVTAITNADGTVLERYAYSPYGGVTVLDANFAADGDQISDIGNTHLYTGREHDPETDLYQYRHRYYHAQLGKFLTRDPIGYLGGYNLYGYVEGSPTKYVDPAGLAKIQCTFEGIPWGARIITVDCTGKAENCCARVDPGIGWVLEDWNVVGALPSDKVDLGEAFREGLQDGAAATADGFIPFVDPFESFYDPCDPTLQWSKTLGGVSRDLVLVAAVPNVGAWSKNPWLYEKGSTTVPLHIWNKIKHLSPIERGRWLSQHYGHLGGWYWPGATSQFGTTVWTGGTPGVNIGLIGGLHGADAAYESGTDPCRCK